MARLGYPSQTGRGRHTLWGLKATHETLDSLFMDSGTFEGLYMGEVIL